MNVCSNKQNPLTLITQQAQNNKIIPKTTQEAHFAHNENNIDSAADKKEMLQSSNSGTVEKKSLETKEQKKIISEDQYDSLYNMITTNY